MNEIAIKMKIDDNREVEIHEKSESFYLVWRNEGKETVVRLTKEAFHATVGLSIHVLNQIHARNNLPIVTETNNLPEEKSDQQE